MTKHLTKPIRAIHFLVLSFLMMIGSQVSAFDPDHIQSFKNNNACLRCDLKGARLEAEDLKNAYLMDSDLSGAKLRGANLSRARLKRATLKSTDLSISDLSRSDLSNANLIQANLEGADLSGANLSGANLEYAYLHGAILCNTTMPDGSVIYSGC